jgi:hypothetical protein
MGRIGLLQITAKRMVGLSTGAWKLSKNKGRNLGCEGLPGGVCLELSITFLCR